MEMRPRTPAADWSRKSSSERHDSTQPLAGELRIDDFRLLVGMGQGLVASGEVLCGRLDLWNTMCNHLTSVNLDRRV